MWRASSWHRWRNGRAILTPHHHNGGANNAQHHAARRVCVLAYARAWYWRSGKRRGAYVVAAHGVCGGGDIGGGGSRLSRTIKRQLWQWRNVWRAYTSHFRFRITLAHLLAALARNNGNISRVISPPWQQRARICRARYCNRARRASA